MKHCEKDFIRQIRKILSTRERRAIEHLPLARAAVLVPLFNKEGNCHIVFTKRSDNVRYHKGEISFPGGVFEEKDGELQRTALREAFEEIGLKENDVQIIGTLDDIITVTQFIVTPFVGIFPYPYLFKLSPIEIAELIEVPLWPCSMKIVSVRERSSEVPGRKSFMRTNMRIISSGERPPEF